MEIAINYNQTQVVELLEKHGAIPVNPKDILQLNLINAAQYGDSEEIKTAIQKGADVNKPDSAGRYALLEFSKSITSTGNKLKTLLELGADPNMLCDYSFLISLKKISPLHAYIIYTANYLKTTNKDFLREIKSNIKLFLDYGAYPSIKDPHGMTPLHSAAKTNHVIAAKLLIKNGAKVYDKDDSGKMPIDYAQSSQMIDLLRQDKKGNLIYIYILLSVIVGLFAIIALLIKKKKSYL
jgi:ankyrin repeat protein